MSRNTVTKREARSGEKARRSTGYRRLPEDFIDRSKRQAIAV